MIQEPYWSGFAGSTDQHAAEIDQGAVLDRPSIERSAAGAGPISSERSRDMCPGSVLANSDVAACDVD